MDQKRMPVAEALEKYIHSNRISMHIPGHKGRSMGGGLLDSILGVDVTEIQGMDDFHNPEGIIKDAQVLAAEVFGARESFFLVNGTTSGIMAALAAAAGEGQAVLVYRDCHKSVIRGLVLSGASPVYIEPVLDSETGLACGITPQALKSALDENRGVRALILPNPSYYGTYSDLRELVKLAHSQGVIVIADEAHGGHLRFAGQPDIPDAMTCGADIAVQSTHKMIGSMTQSSMLHLQGSLVDRDRLIYYIRMLTSTSPSYVLMASLDRARALMASEGREIWQEELKLVSQAADSIERIPGIKVVRQFRREDRICPIEGARLLISGSELGLSGHGLAECLFEKYGIDVEFSDERYIIAVTGSKGLREDFTALTEALGAIAADVEALCQADDHCDCSNDFREDCRAGFQDGSHIEMRELLKALRGDIVMTPRKAVQAPHSCIELSLAEGQVAAGDITIYPPGVPLVQPGELITGAAVEYVKQQLGKGVNVHGITLKEDPEGHMIPMVVIAEDGRRETLFNMMF